MNVKVVILAGGSGKRLWPLSTEDKTKLERNTAPAIALSSLFLDDEDIMVVFPADHMIPEVEKFEKIIKKAIDFARGNYVLITLGIKPTYPETGYGYIELGEKVGIQEFLYGRIE